MTDERLTELKALSTGRMMNECLDEIARLQRIEQAAREVCSVWSDPEALCGPALDALRDALKGESK